MHTFDVFGGGLLVDKRAGYGEGVPYYVSLKRKSLTFIIAARLLVMVDMCLLAVGAEIAK